MKAFEKFVNDSGGYGPPLSLTRKPVFRSSAIFPLFKNTFINSRILFMGYWILKREIAEIGLVYTLRDEKGKLVERRSNNISSPKAFVIELESMLPEQSTADFTGSLEIEVFSSRDMVFPYPAFVVEYYNDTFSTCVHTTGRVFNDFEDFKDSSDYHVSESGFDIRGGKGFEPFFAFVNGPLDNSDPVELEIINHLNRSKKVLIKDLMVKPYETVFLYIKKHVPDLDAFLEGAIGTIKIKHSFKGFFPRFLAGNFDQTKHTVSITHSYYDCSPFSDENSYWKRASTDMHDSSIYAPVFLEGSRNTEFVFYPIYSPSDFNVDLNLLDEKGNSLKHIQGYRAFGKDNGELFRLDIKSIAQAEGISPEKVKGIFVSKSWPDSDLIPSRLKFGLNVHNDKESEALSSNICFNSELGIPRTLQKAGTRKWAPIIHSGESVIVINNSSTLKNYKHTAKISYKIFREADNNYLEREEFIPPLGQVRISTLKDKELREFIGNQPGWIYIDADTPFVNAWYFNFGSSGVVGADHSF